MATKKKALPQVIPTKNGVDQRVRKANEAISIKPTSGKMTFLSRKIFNALLYHAQRQGSLDIYRLPLSELTSSVEYDSKDTQLLRDHLRRMVSTTVEWHESVERPSQEKLWGTGALLSEAEIRFDGRHSTVEWSYGPKIRKFLLDPTRYTAISLQHQALFRSHAGLALFEICSRYETNPSHLTNKEPPTWWHAVLTGNPDQTPDAHFYRYFKRDTLNPAIAEINAMSSLQVELIEHKKGRKVLELQFSVLPRAQASLDLPPPPVIDTALLDRIVAFGISKTEAEDIYAGHPEPTLRSTLGLVETRLKSATLPALDSAAAFFKSALRHGYAAQKPLAAPVKRVAAPVVAPVVEDPVKVAAREAARAGYQGMPEAEKIALLAEFEAASAGNPAVLRSLRKSGLKSKIAEVPFICWLAERQA